MTGTTATSSTCPTSSSEPAAGVHRGALGPGAAYAFLDRTEGVSRPPYDRGNIADHVGDDPRAVAANRALLAAAAGADRFVTMAPRHSCDVARVGRADADAQRRGAPAPPVDALVTTEPGVALLVPAADCVPVVLADGAAGVAGVVHAGWRGVRSGAAVAAVEAMRELGAQALTAVIGPAICGRCYPVDEQRYQQVVAVAPEAAAVSTDGQRALDVRRAVHATLERLGVGVALLGTCTREDPAWYSFRRDRVTGRHGGAVVLAPA